MRTGRLLSISKTDGEWGLIDDKINGKELTVFLRSEINRLITQFKECPDCISSANGNKRERRPQISNYQYNELVKIAKKMKVSPSTVVDRLIIMRLLLPD